MIDPVAFTIFGISVRWYGIIIAVGVILCAVVMVRLAKTKGYKSDLVYDMLLCVLPLALIGARAYYVIFEWERYAANPISALYVWEGGLAIYGGILGGLLGVFILCKWRKLCFMQMLDLIAPGLILAQCIGRWGNFVNQEAFGMPVTDAGMQWFPYAVYIEHPNVINPATGTYFDPGWFQATFFYESMWNLLGFVALMWYFKRAKNRGNVFALYMAFYGAGRAVIENFRTDSLYVTGDIRASVVVSIIFVVLGLAYIFYFGKKLKPLPEYHGVYSLDYVKPDKDAADTADGEADDTTEPAETTDGDETSDTADTTDEPEPDEPAEEREEVSDAADADEKDE